MSKRGMTPKTAEKIRIQRGAGKGTKLRRLRVAAGLSQSELSQYSGVTVQTLRRYEQSPVPIESAKLKTLIALCGVLGCKIEDILENDEMIRKYHGVK